MTGEQGDDAGNDASLRKHVKQLEKALERATKGVGTARGTLRKRLVLRKEPVHVVHPVVVSLGMVLLLAVVQKPILATSVKN